MTFLQNAEQLADGWRSIVIALLGVLVGLIAVVYRDLSRRLKNLETAAREDFIPRKEFESRYTDLLRQIDQRYTEIANSVARIERAIDRRHTGG